MSRLYLANDHIGSHVGSTREGLGVDLLDTRTLSVKIVEEPYIYNVTFLSDGRGTIRIVGRRLKASPASRHRNRDLPIPQTKLARMARPGRGRRIHGHGF